MSPAEPNGVNRPGVPCLHRRTIPALLSRVRHNRLRAPNPRETAALTSPISSSHRELYLPSLGEEGPSCSSILLRLSARTLVVRFCRRTMRDIGISTRRSRLPLRRHLGNAMLDGAHHRQAQPALPRQPCQECLRLRWWERHVLLLRLSVASLVPWSCRAEWSRGRQSLRP